MTTDTSSLKLDILETAGVPYSHFAKYAGISRVTVALWLQAFRNGEVRKLRYPFYVRAVDVLGRIERAHADAILPFKKPDYAELANTLDKYAAS